MKPTTIIIIVTTGTEANHFKIQKETGGENKRGWIKSILYVTG